MQILVQIRTRIQMQIQIRIQIQFRATSERGSKKAVVTKELSTILWTIS